MAEGAATKADGPRPGTTYFVPGFRILRLGALRKGEEAGEPVVDDVRGDVVRVEVTRVHNGASQYSVTLNNWYATTAVERHDGLGAREVEGRANPLWPRYKYNDLQLLKFGDRLRIDMRYWPDPVEGLDAATTSAQNWVPMIAGPVTDMAFSFADKEGAQVTISGEDDLSLLKDKHKGRLEFGHASERDIVLKVLKAANYKLPDLAEPAVEWPEFSRDDARGLAEALQDGQAYLEYLQKLADRLDFEVFTEFADVTRPASGVTFHFEPARSRRPPDRTLRDVYVLRRDKNLLEFTPTIRVADQYSTLIVRGRHRDRNRPQRIEREVSPAILDDELHFDAGQGDKKPKSGPDIRSKYFGDRPNRGVVPNQTNIDEERADWLAKVFLRRKAREFMTVEGKTLGLPRLRPGGHVEIRGMRPPFDGFYYVTKTVHTYGHDGFRTRFSARRPGMPEPPYGEK